ncbi:NAD(P)-dependent dehydrogenase (short-subunit alcohol dehydrogenase family) [Acetivibrio thermocellus AD2]|jgi:NAD(P)-dependent dehydrogenase (short-subunit alcohol dehydrogenase family)|uniref:NAD(P)-dependent dehydrogenase (Short-subunit alcohol dehydrogenase family) n=1 Tax=Acetivibrio thermocellus AD2 TaxID=1138384 RepID=A0AB36TIB0_ACETH|nr:SDR family oxidoreductase [Acetivibrio thermocellus]ADU75303.1 short-chain dehydrogenase/reductase SDR [Acetivibrio thermocellus DSM 1313]ALX09293.1 3-oxoacyl-(acyl-carrier-protein) reductase [Acetivibrio thermocellus AD2]ANV77045.1 3-oxoacyl-(acyl-carrier-protein) reductase [Acetivibrio thermocellus DSM 2360]EIC04761.1 short-chain dehydrogenase/reductase SDR [Acetivibrio thermocellus YS]PFH03568.1 NAD(P)-dependent dehydrogenase (short-subunit alcohol dehydrogenase family) [Acetivibrio ther
MNRGVIVTGGGHGIGKQICLDFLEAGDKVCFIDIDEKRSADFAKEHPNLFYFHGDVADPLTLKKFVEYAMEKLQRIDVLVNNACRGSKGILSSLPYEEFDYILSVGLKAPYELSRLCRDELIKNKGRIINIASTRAFQSEPDSEAYASAKGGIVALTHALAMSLGPDVLVNCIAPGWINVTEQQEFTREDCAAIPAGKVGTPKDISNMVLFLCQQDFITGETIIVDGGMSKRMIYHGDWNWFYKIDK